MTASSTPRLLVVGSVNYDLVFRHHRLPDPGESLVGATFYESPGGKGANQAVAAARAARGRFELEVAFCGAIGDDEFGARQHRVLEGEGIDIRGLAVVAGVASGTSSIWVEEATGQNRILSAPGANARFAASLLSQESFAHANLVLMPNEIPPDTLAAAAGLAAGARVPVIWNPAPFPIGSALPFDPALASLLTPNEVEAAGLLGEARRIDAPRAAATLARELSTRFQCDIVVTLGRQGAVAALGGEPVLHQPAPDVSVVDTTGAGDAFNGALAVARLAGASWPEALAFGVSYASASVTGEGTQTALPTGGADLPRVPAAVTLE